MCQFTIGDVCDTEETKYGTAKPPTSTKDSRSSDNKAGGYEKLKKKTDKQYRKDYTKLNMLKKGLLHIAYKFLKTSPNYGLMSMHIGKTSTSKVSSVSNL